MAWEGESWEKLLAQKLSGTFRIVIREERNKTKNVCDDVWIAQSTDLHFHAQQPNIVEVSLRQSHNTCIFFGVKHTKHLHTFECIAFEMEIFKKFHFSYSFVASFFVVVVLFQ